MNTNRPTYFELLSAQRPVHNRDRRAFTLTELLVVLATLGILAVLLLPALASTQPASTKAFQCLNNMRQLVQAWTLYAEDNHDRLAINSDPHVNNTTFYPAGTSNPSWCTGTLDWTTGQNNTNTAYLTSGSYSLLANYLRHTSQPFACPATATFVRPAQRALGWFARCRSVAMDGAVGDGYKWDVAGFGHGWTVPYFFAIKSTDFHNPGPSDCWVFADEHPDSIDDEIIYTSPYPTTVFTELLGSQHDGAGGITFADGRAEIHKWQGTQARQPVQYVFRQQIGCSITDPDMLWLAQHTPQN